MSRKQDYVTLTRYNATRLLEAIDALDAMERELTYNGGSGWLDAEAFEGSNSDLDANKVVAVVSTTKNALITLLNAGHGTNLNVVRE